jgi:hypothetical protein
MGRSPELDVDAPAYFVVYAGPIRLDAFGAPPPLGQPAIRGELPQVANAVCVVVNGTRTIYTDVDLTGMP